MYRFLWRSRDLNSILRVTLAIAVLVMPAAAQAKRATGVWNLQLDGAFLGIEMEEVSAANMAAYKLSSERGVIVKSVEKGSPAEAAGLQQKDVILEYSGTAVFSSVQFARLVRETPVGRTVDLVISREGKKLTLQAKVGKREADSGFGRELISPGDGSERHFEYRVPGPDEFEFRSPEGGWHSFGFPGGGVYRYSQGKPRLGVTLQPLTDQMAEFLGVPGKRGVIVTSVTEGSAAAGKLKAGDVITRADESVVSEPKDLIDAIQKKDKGGKVDLVVVREKKQITVSVVLPEDESKGAKGGYRL